MSPLEYLKAMKTAFEYMGFLIFATLFGRLPIERASRFSGWMWEKICPYLSRQKRAVKHLKMAMPELTDPEIQHITKGMWNMLGRTFAEGFHLPELYDSARIYIENEAYWRERLAVFPPQGGIFCCAHSGNWEVASVFFRRLGLNNIGVYKSLSNRLIDHYIYDLRAPLYPGGLLPKGSKAAKQIMRHAEKGGCCSMLADLRDKGGVEVPFFGHPAPSTTFPALLARNYDRPLFASRVLREPNVHFALSLVEIPVPKTEDKLADIHAATAALHAQFEAWIRETPEQWMWAHKRWG